MSTPGGRAAPPRPWTAQFPRGFYLGSSTSAHQVEGGTHNDWTAWETSHAASSARWAARWPPPRRGPAAQRAVVRAALRPDATDPARYLSGRAAGHVTRYPQDLRAAADLGLTAYRFSVEWSRIEPEPGHYDHAWLDHYAQRVQCARDLGQEPFLTLWHFTLPAWAARAGGWSSPEVVERFGAYAAVVATALRGQVRWICTMNEPEIYLTKGYLLGAWPPGRRLALRARAAARQGITDGHRVAAAEVRRADSAMAVGFSSSQTPVVAGPLLRPLANVLDGAINDWFTERLAGDCDWLGVQYYVRAYLGRDARRPLSDLDWPLVPELLERVLLSVARYGLPTVVTESGLADALDRHRAWYLEESLHAVARALAAGADCRGYLHWSLLDNHEWSAGAWPRFGLFAVDPGTLERTARPSALHYRDLVTQIRSGWT